MFKRKDNGLWQESVTLKGSTRKKYFYGRTKAEVLRKISEYKDDFEKGVLFSVVADKWWEEAEPQLAHNTTKSYKPALGRCKDEFKGKYIKSISPPEINQFIKDFARTHADKTVRTQLMVTNLIFKFAVANGYAPYNTARDLNVPKGLSKQKIHSPSPEDIKRVKDSVEKPFGLFAYMAMYTGMRRGELLALDWSDIDLKNRTITINKSLYHESNTPKLKEPKTEASAGMVPIMDALLPVLRRKRGHVFPNADGGYMTNMQFAKAWRDYCAESGVEATPHQFRHCYATMLVEAGIAPEKAQALLRHAQLSTTMDVYREIRGDERAKIFREVYSVDIA